MAILLNQAPALNTDGSEWVSIGSDAKLLVGSAANTEYRAKHHYLDRHMSLLDQAVGAGTGNFDIDAGALNTDEEELRRKLAAKYLVKDWRGVGVDENQNEAPCTPENVDKLFQIVPAAYRIVLQRSMEIAVKMQEQQAETLGK